MRYQLIPRNASGKEEIVRVFPIPKFSNDGMKYASECDSVLHDMRNVWRETLSFSQPDKRTTWIEK